MVMNAKAAKSKSDNCAKINGSILYYSRVPGPKQDRCKLMVKQWVRCPEYPHKNPSNTTVSCSYKVIWNCPECGEEFLRTVVHMSDLSRSEVCNKCSKRQAVVGRIINECKNPIATSSVYLNQLADKEKGAKFIRCIDYPELTADNISINSSCHCKWCCNNSNHVFEAIVSNFLGGKSGCPFCSGYYPVVGENDYLTLCIKHNRFDIIEAYAAANNTEPLTKYTWGSSKKVNVKCSKCKKIVPKVLNKLHKSPYVRCNECSKKTGDSLPQRIVHEMVCRCLRGHNIKTFYKHSGFSWLENGRELDIYIEGTNNKYAIEYDGVWHKKHPDRDEKKDGLCIDNGINLIRIREPMKSDYSQRDGVFVVERSSSSIDMDLQSSALAAIKYIIDKEQIKVDLESIDLDVKKIAYEMLAQYEQNVPYERSLSKKKPYAALWFDDRYYAQVYGVKKTPNMVYAESNVPYMFSHYSTKDGVYHSWMRTPNKIRGTLECPVCNHRVLQCGVNDAATLFPDLINYEWDHESNSKLGYFPNKILGAPAINYYWKCLENDLHGSYIATLNSRVSKLSGCPKCAKENNKKKVKAYSENGDELFAESVSEMARKLGYKSHTIVMAINDRRWVGGRNANNKVVNLITGEEFSLKKDAAKACGVCVETFNKMLAKGDEWVYVTSPKWYVEYVNEGRKRGAKKVRNVTTGMEYDSINEASRVVGVTRASIFLSLKSGKAVKGNLWEYVIDDPT